MRPKQYRKICGSPESRYFKPEGVPSDGLKELLITMDEYEAIRLADLEGMYQEEAACSMGISRQTFGRIIESAHLKIADAIVNLKVIHIEGGRVHMDGKI